MVRVLTKNEYFVSQSEKDCKMLVLDRKYYKWFTDPIKNKQYLKRIEVPKIQCKTLINGNYWLFEVINNSSFTRGIHLSLADKNGHWQAYILTHKLPLKLGQKCELIPTDERIARRR